MTVLSEHLLYIWIWPLLPTSITAFLVQATISLPLIIMRLLLVIPCIYSCLYSVSSKHTKWLFWNVSRIIALLCQKEPKLLNSFKSPPLKPTFYLTSFPQLPRLPCFFLDLSDILLSLGIFTLLFSLSGCSSFRYMYSFFPIPPILICIQMSSSQWGLPWLTYKSYHPAPSTPSFSSLFCFSS